MSRTPSLDGLSENRLVWLGDISGDAKPRGRLQDSEKIRHHRVIAVWRLNEYLSLSELGGTLLKLFDGFTSLLRLSGKITLESETLAVET